MADGNIDEVVRKINKEKGVKGFIIINSEGIPIKDSFDEMEPKMLTIHYAALITSLVAKARTAVRDLDATNELTFLRLRSRKHEILVAPDKVCVFFSFSFLVVFSETKIQQSHNRTTYLLLYKNQYANSLSDYLKVFTR